MRIALVVPGGVDRSGEYRVIPALLGLIERLSRAHDVQVIALAQEPSPGSWDLAGARIHNIGSVRTRLRAIKTIRQLNRRLPFGLVHAIWSANCGLVAVVSARLLGIPSVVHVTGGEVVALRDIGYGGRLSWRGRAREAMVLRAAAAVSATSAPVLDLLSQLGVRATRVPLGVDLDSWPALEPRRRDRARPARLIQVASLNRVKDQHTLMHALAAMVEKHVRFEMDIVGEDILDGAIQLLAARLGVIDFVRFHGFLTQRQLRPMVAQADLMIVSSRHEAGPMVMLEAAVVGVPTVGTSVGHVAEWGPDAAVAVPVGEPAALASAIERVLADEDLRLRLARAAQTRAMEQDANYTASCFETIYRRLS